MIIRKYALCFLVLILSFSLFSCASDVDGQEIFVENEDGETVLEDLLEKSKLLNLIYFGDGIPLKENGVKSGVYCEADPIFLEEHGLSDIESIKEETEAIFSPSMCNMLYGRAFENFKTGTSVSRVRYYEDDEGHLMVRTTEESLLNGEVTYDCSSAKIKSTRKNRVTLLMQATVTTSNGLCETETIRVVLQKTADGWRLDCPTYLVYYAD